MSPVAYKQKPMLGQRRMYIPGHPLGLSGGLIGDWLFDTPGSDIVQDCTPNRWDGALTGMDPATDWMSGEMGTCLDFDRNNDYILLPAAIDPAGWSAFAATISVRYDSSGGAEHSLISNWNLAGGDTRGGGILLRLEPSDDTVECFAWVEPNTEIGGTFADLVLTPNKWHHITAIFDTTSLRAALDGRISTTTFASGATLDTTTAPDPFRIGSSPHAGTDLLGGQVARVSFYSRAPSTKEVLGLYRDPYCMFEPLTKRAWWWDAMAAPPAVGNWPLLKGSNLGKDLFRAGVN